MTGQSISCDIQMSGEDDIKMTTVYAKCNQIDRLDLWDDLRNESNTSGPWIGGGGTSSLF